jgi:hypothetical protein
MSIKVQANFAGGELDPALHERTTLGKYNTGLATGRNVIIGKTGRVMSRPGREIFQQCKLADKKVKIYSPPGTGYVLEWGHQYVRSYAYNVTGISSSFKPGGVLVNDDAHALTESDLDYIHFVTAGDYVYICRQGSVILKYFYGPGGGFISAVSIFVLPGPPTNATITATGTTGYYVDYAITLFKNGEESTVVTIPSAGTYKIPINAGETNQIKVRVKSGTTADASITEIRVYRRPESGGAYGFIGSSSQIASDGSNIIGTFMDVGGAADYTHIPPAAVDNFVYRGGTDARVLNPIDACIYQQRLLQVDSASNSEAILASRPGFWNNFYRDYPLGADSALKFKSGASGRASVLRMLENDGLVVFTTIGVFLHVGALSTTNLSLEKKGNWIIDVRVPPLAIPGGVLFVDSATNTIRVLSWSTEAASYSGEELSVFSNHLFTAKRIKSWGFHTGDIPLLFVVFDDGTFASFTYEREHEMRAWTRHDSADAILVEEVCGTDVHDTTFFVVNKSGTRYIEVTKPRYPSSSVASYTYFGSTESTANTEYDKNSIMAAMDSIITKDGRFNVYLVGADKFVLTKLGATWSDSLTLTCGTSALFTVGATPVGTILRFFNPDDGTAVDLEVTARASNNSITVEPSAEFPSTYATDANIYLTGSTLTGLDAFNGESVSVIVDGYVVASPNNDIEAYPTITVSGGSLTLPNSLRGAIIHVGRPFVMDVETLDIDTVEQRPTLIESKTVNKVYVKVHKSRGVYASNKFPRNDNVEGMVDLDSLDVDYEGDSEGDIIGNRCEQQVTKRVEVMLPGDWKSNGKICLRQVDPLHFEILSIVPDVDDQRRS